MTEEIIIENIHDTKKRKKIPTNLILVIISFVVTIVIASIIFYFVFGKGYHSEQSITDAYVESLFKNDADAIIEMLTEDVKNEVLSQYDGDKDALSKALKESFSTSLDNLTTYYGEDYKYTYDITNQIEATEQDIEEYKKEAKENDYKYDNPEAIKKIEVTIFIKYNSETGYEYIDLAIGKFNGKWYLLGMQNGF